MERISGLIDQLSETFFELPLVVEYFRVVDLINGDDALLALSDEVKKWQKRMTLSMNDNVYHSQFKAEYETKLNLYNSHPYIVNYTYLKNEIEDLLNQMKHIIELP